MTAVNDQSVIIRAACILTLISVVRIYFADVHNSLRNKTSHNSATVVCRVQTVKLLTVLRFP